ncbi:MAG: class I SAM-dependent methyltransferase [Nocardioidaceae bacterium]
MDEILRTRRAASFGGVADVYERTRPGYPDEAVRWMAGSGPAKVLEVGAGTGKLTASLLAQGHLVVATDPTAQMLRPLRRNVAEAPAAQCISERLPFASSSFDVVVTGQAFHWFDSGQALPEIARVLRPGGVFALVWNIRDESVPWVRRLGRLMGSEELESPVEVLEASGLFDGVEHETFRHWQEIHRDSLMGLVESRSYVAEMGEDDRAALLEQVGQLYDDYGRGHDGMLLPYHCDAFRCRVSGLADSRRDQDPPLDDGLLIDFS